MYTGDIAFSSFVRIADVFEADGDIDEDVFIVSLKLHPPFGELVAGWETKLFSCESESKLQLWTIMDYRRRVSNL